MKRTLFRVLLLASLLLIGRTAPAAAQSRPYLLPLPGSGYNPAGTTIAIRYGDTIAQGDVAELAFDVAGASSGKHTGAVVLSDEGQTLIFKPDQPFAEGEMVSASVPAWTGSASGVSHPAANFTFSVVPAGGAKLASTTGSLIRQSSAPPLSERGTPLPAPQAQYLTVPADFPRVSVTSPATGTAPGLIFAANFGVAPDPSGYYLMILDNNGQPVYYQKLAADSRALDFKALPNGTLAYSDFARNAFVILDNSYREIDSIRPGNGYQQLDEHDLLLLPNGHYLILASEARTINLGGSGGKADASVTGQIIQELDRSKNVIFQWRALDYIPPQDTAMPLDQQLIDYSHSNAVEVDADGNLLLSSRHLDEITKVSRQTGDVIWRMGGKHNQFTFRVAPGVNGPAEFYHQHDVRRLPNGHITLFDNHNDHQPMLSRALEYVVDENAHTATLVWSYATTPPPYSEAMGNVQRLPNGNTVIGWGTNLLPQITEVRPDGTRALELDFAGPDVSYRGLRFEWHGYPTWPPALVAQANGNAMRLTFSWNGATEVASYRIYGGDTLPPSNLIGEQKKLGFETGYDVQNASTAYCYYQVVPVDANGNTNRGSQVVVNPARGWDCAARSLAPLAP